MVGTVTVPLFAKFDGQEIEVGSVTFDLHGQRVPADEGADQLH